MTKARPLIAVCEGWGVSKAIESVGAEVLDIDTISDVDVALEYVDGFVLTGGGDVDPSRYNAEPHAQVYGVDSRRDAVEFYLVAEARKRNIPVMGICRGSQVLNVAYGGTLNQNINDDPSIENHWGVDLWVKVSPRSTLSRAIRTLVMRSSHYHHQAVRSVGPGLVPIARAGDGTIEAIESAKGNPHYVLGVQFHPEHDYHYDPVASSVFEHFRNVCARRSTQTTSSMARLNEAEMQTRRRPTFDYRTNSMMTDYEMAWGKYLSDDKYDWDEKVIDFDTKQDLDSVCGGMQCLTPRDCLAYGDCTVDIENAKAQLGTTTEHVKLLEADEVEAYLTAANEEEAAALVAEVHAKKRGHKRGVSFT
jgi:putative glutamine amidotransferase